MKSLKYFEQLENLIYKCTEENDEEMLKFLKSEEENIFNSLTQEQANILLHSIFDVHPSLLTNPFPTDTLILHQLDDKLPLKRLINKLVDSTFSDSEIPIFLSTEVDSYLCKEMITNPTFFTFCSSFRTDYIERIIGRVFENKDIEEKAKTKIIKDLLFTYYTLEEDKKNIHDIKSADILARRFDMVDDFLGSDIQASMYHGFLLDSMITNIINGNIIDSKEKVLFENTYANVQVESLLTPLSTTGLVELGDELKFELSSFNIDFENSTYYKETQKVFQKTLVNNVNK